MYFAESGKHSMRCSVAMHLIPGLITAAGVWIVVRISEVRGIPASLGSYFADLLVLAPLELGILIYISKKKNGTGNFLSLITWREHSSAGTWSLYIVLMLIWALLVDNLLAPLETRIMNFFSSFYPKEFFIDYSAAYLSNHMIIILAIAGTIVNGFLAPFVEECYFRGYLLPRINLPINKAIVLSAVLFSLYHFFSPWYFLSRVLMTIPMYWMVAREKNLRLSVAGHMIANCFTSLSVLSALH